MLNGGLHPRHLTPKRVSIEGSFLFLLRWSTIFCIAVLVRWKNYSKKRCDDSFLNSSFLSSFELIDHDNNFGKNFSKLFPSERTIKFLSRRLSIGRDGSFRIRSMFHFVHVNESIEVFFRFMNHPLPSPSLLYPSIPRMARSSQVFGSEMEVSRHRLARLKTSVSSSCINDFPTS